MTWAIPSLRSEKFRKPEPPPKNVFLLENVIFRGLMLSIGHLVNKSLKALCLSFKMVYQHLLFLLSFWTNRHFKITQGPTRFFSIRILGGVKRQTSRAAYNVPETAVTDDFGSFGSSRQILG